MQRYNLEFSDQELQAAVSDGRLLSLEIECSRICNFRCTYCYVEGQTAPKDELSLSELQNVILQAKTLGAGKIIILGGEPSIYPQLRKLIEFIDQQGLTAEMFTNGSGVTVSLAAFLAEKNVRVALKLNSRDEAVQDTLAGRKGAYRLIQSALKALCSAGYPSEKRFLAISTVICQQNRAELPEMWRWLRGQNIEPYFEIITPQSEGLRNTWLHVSPFETQALFEEFSRIDREEFGRDWEPQPPLAGNRCMRHLVSCVVTSTGDVMPCVGVTIPVGNIREKRLEKILAESDVIRNLKNYREMIKGPCRICEKAAECYGCRGAAYQLTGDYLASDPTCWKIAGKHIPVE